MTDTAGELISIVIPVYCSADILPHLHRRVMETFSEREDDYELILACDAPPDNSWAVIEELAEQDPKVKGVLLRRNFGMNGALMAGFGYVRGKYVVVMDDDLQHAPEDIPKLLAEIRKGHDLVYTRFPEIVESPFKRLGSAVNGIMGEVLLHKPKGIYLSAFKVFRSELAGIARKYTGPYPYVDGLLLLSTSSISEVEVEHHERFSGEGHHSLIPSLRVWLNHATSFSVYPLRLVVLLGLCFALLSMATALYWFVYRLFGGEAPEGWATIIVAIFFIGGLQFMALGAIGEYLGRAYLTLNERPQYIVRSTRNID